MLGAILFIHRYLGVAVGLVMTVWCLSGFVMMYQAYPETTRAERLAGLAPLALAAEPAPLPLDANGTVDGLAVEMMGGAPVARVSTDEGQKVYSLDGGRQLEGFSAQDAELAAALFAQARGIQGPGAVKTIVRDQWAVQLARRHGPIHRVRFADPAGTEVYVSGRTGEVIQDTTRKERILGWLGAVPHWLYPSVLRQHSGTWIQVVIWSSVVGLFLTVTGLYVGLAKWWGAPKGRLSPFRGLWLWHHMAGLAFGLLTLTWTFSGLLSMNPWGLLESQGGRHAQAYAGALTSADANAVLAAAPLMAKDGVVRLEVAPVGGKPFVIATAADGSRWRFDAEGAAAPLRGAEVEAALGALDAPLASLELLNREDAYYYGHHDTVDLPVWRAILGNEDRTRLYIDARSGAVRRVADAPARQYRWLQSGLHDFDFPVLRSRPLWDIAVLLLLAGVTLSVATGTWLAWRRIRRDLAGLKRNRA